LSIHERNIDDLRQKIGDYVEIVENIIFPDPEHQETVTELIDAIGGAAICWGDSVLPGIG